MKNEMFRVLRGGCWSRQLSFARVASRSLLAPGYRYLYLGVRLARIVNPLQQLGEVKNGQ